MRASPQTGYAVQLVTVKAADNTIGVKIAIIKEFRISRFVNRRDRIVLMRLGVELRMQAEPKRKLICVSGQATHRETGYVRDGRFVTDSQLSELGGLAQLPALWWL